MWRVWPEDQLFWMRALHGLPRGFHVVVAHQPQANQCSSYWTGTFFEFNKLYVTRHAWLTRATLNNADVFNRNRAVFLNHNNAVVLNRNNAVVLNRNRRDVASGMRALETP
jgi:hypothetical protein